VDLYGGVSVPQAYSLKIDTKMVWTTTATTDNTTEGKQTATATVSCPSAQYTGEEGMYLWWDSRYGSFVFIPYDPGVVPMIHKGSVVSRSGHPIGGQLVTMTYGGKTYRTYSAPDGTYHFPSWSGKNIVSGTAEIETGGVKQTVQIGKTHEITHPLEFRMK